MDREILFRGKGIHNSQWYEGVYSPYNWDYSCGRKDKPQIIVISSNGFVDGMGVSVIPETVGEFTGLTDKNGTRTFEGDLIEYPLFPYEIGVIRYGEYQNPFNDNRFTRHIGFYVEWLTGTDKDFLRKDLGYWLKISEIIGNVYDNPELLKESGTN